MKKLLLAAGFSLLVAMPALAKDDEPRSKTVSYADLDLATTAGRETLDRRLRSAVRTVCGPANHRDVALHMNERRCFKTTLLSARQQATLAAAKRESSVRLAAR